MFSFKQEIHTLFEDNRCINCFARRYNSTHTRRENGDQVLASVCSLLHHSHTIFRLQRSKSRHYPTAVIEPSAKIGVNCHIGSHAYIGEDVIIGDNSKVLANSCIYENSIIGNNTTIRSNVSIYYQTIIGDDCLIHSGTVIGADGFGHAPLPDGTYIKIPQIGNVVIGNKVEIGSNTSIDRANMGSTIIGNGCRIDNLVQIAHGVEIGENTVLAGGVFVAGSTKIGSNCVFAGQAGVVGHITVANGTQLGGQAGINKDITEPNGIYTGSPHQSFKEEMKSRVMWRNLPKLEQRVRELEQQLKSNK